MASSDIFTISALLVLIMGAVCFYLYTRIKQVEKKVTLVEGILLDLKTATEASFMDFPAASSYMLAKDIGEEEDDADAEAEADVEEPFIPQAQVAGTASVVDSPPSPKSAIKPFEMEEVVDDEEEAPFVPAAALTINKVEEMPIVEADVEAEAETPVMEAIDETSDDQVNLELLNVKELIAIARSKNLPVSRTMRKQQLIELINTGSASALLHSNEEPITMTGSSLTAAPF
jgi:hypothetical protein